MKRMILLAAVALTWAACGNKTQKTERTGDSLTVAEIADSTGAEEAVARQVQAVYEYLANYKEGQPWLDGRFGTKEWQQAIAELERTDKGKDDRFFDDGFSPWTLDFYEGKITADSVTVRLLPNGVAEAAFRLKDAVSVGERVQWWLKMEDGEWRVQTIFNHGANLLQDIRVYVDDDKFGQEFSIQKYLSSFQKLASPLYEESPENIHFDGYALFDVDRDGRPEVYVRSKEQSFRVVYSIAGDTPSVLADAWGGTDIVFFEHGVGAQGSCGTGCMLSDCAIVKNSKATVRFRSVGSYDMEGNLQETVNKKDDKDVTEEEMSRLFDQLGESLDLTLIWHEIEDDTPASNLSDYAE